MELEGVKCLKKVPSLNQRSKITRLSFNPSKVFLKESK